MVEPEVEVAVLGPVEIRGGAQSFRRMAARELVVYLVFHRRGMRNEEWAEALWPSRSMALPTLHSTASDARRALGKGAEGLEHLPRSGRTLRLGNSVGSDVETFSRWASSKDPVHWKNALELIRGPLFEGLALSDWAVFEGIRAQVESMVAVTALKGAAHFLERGSGRQAERMVRQAMRVSPFDERLHRALLRATESQGNRVGLRSTMDQLLVLAAETGDPRPGLRCGEPGGKAQCAIHPETMALYRELTRGTVPVVGRHPVRL
jgi:DNA-binding SARP family transcriptional activator